MINKILIAEKGGISSLKQLRVFLLHSDSNLSISEATGLDCAQCARNYFDPISFRSKFS